MLSLILRQRPTRKLQGTRRSTTLRLEQLESRITPSSDIAVATVLPLPASAWQSATGTPNASTVVVSVAPGTANAIALLSPAAAAEGATVAPTSLAGMFTVS